MNDMVRSRMMVLGQEDKDVKVKKYTYTPNKDIQVLNIPLDFEPETIILYDRYPNDYYLENGSHNFGANLALPIVVKDGDYNFSMSPYSTTAVNISYADKCTVTYDGELLTIDVSNTNKYLKGNHTYTFIVLGKVETEIIA